jgi:hypothetical protein
MQEAPHKGCKGMPRCPLLNMWYVKFNCHQRQRIAEVLGIEFLQLGRLTKVQ